MEESKVGNVGVICIYTVGEEGFIAGFLVVDSQGEPVEFRATETLTPTKLQRALYGDSLHSLVAPRLLAKPLLDAARNKPGVLLTNDDSVLSLRRALGIPLVHVDDEEEEGSEGPVRFVSAKDFEADAETVRGVLGPNGLDASELLERVSGAIDLVLKGE